MLKAKITQRIYWAFTKTGEEAAENEMGNRNDKIRIRRFAGS